MKKFKRRGGVISSHLSEYEVSLLTNLVDQLIGMVAEEKPAAPAADEDPFEALARDLEDKADPPEDPVLRRLFPDAYPGDPEASADFRRFTQRELSDKKVTEALVVRTGLEQTQGGAYEVRIPVDDADLWLRTLTSLRLAVAIRLGITDADTADELSDLPDDDPRAFMASVYDWLGFAEETLISAL
ncbi:DUF2017 domain-containing protein [Microlunatus ginsengisoli]|uniref:DUF2017 domain-containing protein n=1 Tax=Microlunatus ginsengisoli TaxID=363863 RepID=A0ABP6ZFR2_9ACTN